MGSYYTVSQVAKETGVTIKTLHHYQKIQLLLPAKIGENGYRYYSEADIQLLQEILLYRTMGFSLNDVKEFMSLKEHSTRIQRLEHQKSLLLESIEETKIMLQTINHSIAAEQEEQEMTHKEMFDGVEKEDDSIYRTMQNMTIIFSKVYALTFFIFGILLTVFFINNLIKGGTDYGLGGGDILIPLMFIAIGVFTFLISGYNLFFTRTKDLLKTINEQYINKKDASK